jgi:hypothetical protein
VIAALVRQRKIVSGVTKRWQRSARGNRCARAANTARSAQFQAWSWVGAAQDGDLVPQHEELNILGGGRAAH